MRSKLTVLQVAYESQADVATRAQYAWSRLSQACHQHAYELSPSVGEVRHLLALVEKSLPADDQRQGSELGLRLTR